MESVTNEVVAVVSEEAAAKEQRRTECRRRRKFQWLVQELERRYGGKDNEPQLPEYRVKEKVRERDGGRCRDCGISEERHIKKTGRGLDVHRVFPGWQYSVGICVLLCRRCHGKKKNREDVDQCNAYFNLYRSDAIDFLESLAAEAKKRKTTLHQLFSVALENFFHGSPSTTATRGGDCRP